jgi:hypothetical protein
MSESNLEDCAAIHDLFTRYCCVLDNGEIEAVVDCFTVDAILKSPVIDINGRDEIRAFASRSRAATAGPRCGPVGARGLGGGGASRGGDHPGCRERSDRSLGTLRARAKALARKRRRAA